MENILDISEENEYLKYFELVTQEVIKLGISDEGELAKLIDADTVHDICIRHFIDNFDQAETAKSIKLFWDKIY